MPTTTSADGTAIAYDSTGAGPALVIVDGALCSRDMGPSGDLAAELAASFTVYRYDRRGRGGSGDATAYAADREVEDLAAVIAAAGGSAAVLGVSSGAALALAAAAAGAPITALVTYEAPFIVDGSRPPIPASTVADVRAMVDTGDRSKAVKTFLRLVGTPGFVVTLMPLFPVWRKLTGVAHTLPYDLSIVTPYEGGHPLPDGLYAAITAPTLVLVGGKSPQWMKSGQTAIAAAVPGATEKVLPGQTHMVKAKVVAPEVTAFLSARRTPHER